MNNRDKDYTYTVFFDSLKRHVASSCLEAIRYISPIRDSVKSVAENDTSEELRTAERSASLEETGPTIRARLRGRRVSLKFPMAFLSLSFSLSLSLSLFA